MTEHSPEAIAAYPNQTFTLHSRTMLDVARTAYDRGAAEAWDEGARFGFNTAKSNHDWQRSNPYRAAAIREQATTARPEPNDGPGPDGNHVETGECFACLVGVATGPESHGEGCVYAARPELLEINTPAAEPSDTLWADVEAAVLPDDEYDARPVTPAAEPLPLDPKPWQGESGPLDRSAAPSCYEGTTLIREKFDPRPDYEQARSKYPARTALDKVLAMLNALHPVEQWEWRGHLYTGCPSCRSTGPCETRRLTEAAIAERTDMQP